MALEMCYTEIQYEPPNVTTCYIFITFSNFGTQNQKTMSIQRA